LSATKARELAVLALIAAHAAHGYAIAAEFERSFGRLLGVNRQVVYAVLDRLRRRGWAKSRQEAAGNYPDREVFAPTPAGTEAVARLAAKVAAAPNLPISPLLALLMTHEMSGVAVDFAALADQRRTVLEELDASAAAHPRSAALDLARKLLAAERDVLEKLDRSPSGPS